MGLMANVLAKSTLLETSVMKLNLDTTNSLIPNLVNATWTDLKTTLATMKINATANVTSRVTSVTNALKDSLAFPTAKAALAMIKDQKTQSVTLPENVLAKLTSKATVVINASLPSMVSLIVKLVNVTPRDQRQPIHAMSPENVLANPTLLETSVTNVQKVSA